MMSEGPAVSYSLLQHYNMEREAPASSEVPVSTATRQPWQSFLRKEADAASPKHNKELDISQVAADALQGRCPEFPPDRAIARQSLIVLKLPACQ